MTASLRGRRTTAAAALLVAIALVTLLLLRSEEPETAAGIDIPAGREHAEAACRAADEVFRIVSEDGPAPDVVAAAESAKQQSAAARDADPMWSTLASGADALLEGLRRDDGRAAGLGRRVVDLECRRLRLPGPAATGPP